MLVHLLPLLTFALIALIVYIGMRWLVQGNATVERLGHTEKRSLAFGPLTVALAGVVPMTQRGRQTIAAELRHAGHYRPFALEEFLATRNALIVCWLLLVATALFALVRPVNDPTPLILIAGVVGLVVCFAVPRLVLQSQATRRLARIRVGLPDALDMITMCLSGGLPLQTALERVSGELRGTHPDFAWELDIIRRHCAAHTLEHALVQFSDRIDVPEVKSLTALITQTEQLGTNIAGALREFADGIRRNHRQRAEERGNKTSVKLLLPVVLCLAPPIYILLLAPALLELRDFMVRENREGGILSSSDMSPNLSLDEVRSLSRGTATTDDLRAQRANR